MSRSAGSLARHRGASGAVPLRRLRRAFPFGAVFGVRGLGRALQLAIRRVPIRRSGGRCDSPVQVSRPERPEPGARKLDGRCGHGLGRQDRRCRTRATSLAPSALAGIRSSSAAREACGPFAWGSALGSRAPSGARYAESGGSSPSPAAGERHGSVRCLPDARGRASALGRRRPNYWGDAPFGRGRTSGSRHLGGIHVRPCRSRSARSDVK
jgi:hypothetical protein